MRVKITNYGASYSFIGWVGKIIPHDLAVKLDGKIGHFLIIKKIVDFLNWFGKRTISIKVKPYDAFNAFDTMALLNLAILKEFRKAFSHEYFGYPSSIKLTRDECRLIGIEYRKDPHDYNSKTTEEDDKLYGDACAKKWISFVDQMIWSFEQIVNDDINSKFWIKKPVWEFKKDTDSGMNQMITTESGEFDEVGYNQHKKQINDGLILFAKYFQNLWW